MNPFYKNRIFVVLHFIVGQLTDCPETPESASYNKSLTQSTQGKSGRESLLNPE